MAGTQDNLNDLWEYTISSGEWTWMGGSNLVDVAGVYGTKGTAAPANIPGARYQCRHMDGHVRKFLAFRRRQSEVNGTTVDSFNDLWEFSTVSKEWTWMNGSNASTRMALMACRAQRLRATLQGRGAIYSVGRIRPEISGFLEGLATIRLATTAQVQVDLNDLWEYSVSTNEWTWKNGPNVGNGNGTFGTLGQLAPGNIPASREGGASWADASGNLWLFCRERG